MGLIEHIKSSRGFEVAMASTMVELMETGDLSFTEISLPSPQAWAGLLAEPEIKTPGLAITACHHTVVAVNDVVLFRTELMGTPGRAYQLWVRPIDIHGQPGPIVHLVGGKTANQDHLYFPVDRKANIQFSLPRTAFPDGRLQVQAHILDLKGGQTILDLGETLL